MTTSITTACLNGIKGAVEDQVSVTRTTFKSPAGHCRRAEQHIMDNSSAFTICEGQICKEIYLSNTTEEDIRELENYTSFIESYEDDDILNETPWRSAVIAVYSVIILLGFLENFLVLFVLIRNRHLRETTNIFIIGLSMSDILLCLFNLPVQLHYQLTNQWAFGETLCRVFMPTYAVPVFVSSMSILMIAIDRYMRIVHPLRQHLSCTSAVALLIFIAICTSFLVIPVIIQAEYNVIDFPQFNFHRTYCVEIWSSLKLRHIYTAATVSLQFFVPLCATSVLYMKIMSVRSQRLSLRKKEKENKNRTNKILISVVLLFSVCWLPWNVFALILEFKPLLIPTRYIKFCDLASKAFAMSSACINPFLYGWLNGNFRRGLSRVFQKDSASERTRFTKLSNRYTDSPL